MAPTLLASDTFSFADGNSPGHVCNLGSAPSVGQVDVLCVNSDTTVSTPSGFTLPTGASKVTNQGAYIFHRKAVGGEGSTVTVITSGNFNAIVSWERWGGLNAHDVSAGTEVNSSVGVTTPTHSTGTLGATGELVVAFGAMHSIGGTGNQNTPVWSSGFTGQLEAKQAVGSQGCYALVGHKIGAGTAAESPNVSWSGDGCFDRYMITSAFSAASGLSGTLNRVTVTETVRTVTCTKSVAIGRVTETSSVRAASRQKAASLARVVSTETARAVTAAKVRALARIVTTEAPRTLTGTKARTLARVGTTETARSATWTKVRTLGRVGDLAIARSVSSSAGPAVPPEVWGVEMGLV